MSPITILGLLLAISVIGNAWLGQAYVGVRDERTVAIGERDDARGAASACSDATEALRELYDKRTIENKAAVAQAAAAATARAAAAQRLLATPATRPGDDCGSAGDRFSTWLQERGKP